MVMGQDTRMAMGMPASTSPALLPRMHLQMRFRKPTLCMRSWPRLPSGVSFRPCMTCAI